MKKNSALYIAPIIILFFIVQEAISTGILEVFSGQSSNTHIEFFNMVIHYSPLVLLLPFLAAIPYAAVFAEDVNSKYLYYSIHRMPSVWKYCTQKFKIVWLSGFFTTFIPLMFFGIICIIFAEPLLITDPNFDPLMRESAWEFAKPYANGSIVVLLQIFFLSCFSASCAVIGFAASAYLPNQFFVWCFPLILCYGMHFLSSRLHFGLINLKDSYDPLYSELGFQGPYSGIIYMIIYHLAVILICFTLFYFGVQRRVSGGSFRFRFVTAKKMEKEY